MPSSSWLIGQRNHIVATCIRTGREQLGLGGGIGSWVREDVWDSRLQLGYQRRIAVEERCRLDDRREERLTSPRYP